MPKKSKKSKKHKKVKSKNYKTNKSKRESSDSSESGNDSSEESSEYEWVEKNIEKPVLTAAKHEDWMLEDTFVPTYSIHETKRKSEKSDVDRNLLDKPGQSSRELNPYWKNNGIGLPEESKNDKFEVRLPSHTVGDKGVEWLKKALKRAKEQAQEEGRRLEDIAAERYGSLENLYRLIDEAEDKRRHSGSKSRNHSYNDTYRSSSSKVKSGFMKPSDDVKHYTPIEGCSSKSNHGWRKKKNLEDRIEIKKIEENISPSESKPVVLLTDNEMNSLASRILKAEIMGNTSLAKELSEKLEDNRKLREQSKNENKDSFVLLTNTNIRGVTQPVRGKTDQVENKRKKTYQTHADGKRVRYFEDDEKYSLTEMFEREQMKSTADSNAEFVQLATKTKVNKDYAIDDLFMEQTTSNRSKKEREMQYAVEKQKRTEKALDNCTWCLMNNKLQKHLIISTSSKCYLSVPYFHSLTEGHCLIAPIYHATCTTLLDEDIWEEILNYCKNLVKMFKALNQDVVFFENALNFKYYPHMVIHCVPIPYDSGNLAPLYFKKAILECEKEWSQNKKLVNVNKMDVKSAIPKGLPYFTVNFGLDYGFAHVIEEEKYFPKNFAQEVIGGILDLDHHIWRKQRPDDLETQYKKVNTFKSMWEKIELSTKPD